MVISGNLIYLNFLNVCVRVYLEIYIFYDLAPHGCNDSNQINKNDLVHRFDVENRIVTVIYKNVKFVIMY